MKAVIPNVPAHIIDWRRGTGADRYDEMWEGVLHMPPSPNRAHQDLEFELHAWLRQHWARPSGNRVHHQVNLAAPGGWPEKNYRVPDLVMLTPERFEIDHNEYFSGAPTVVIEIHSPDDESYDKLPFYADLRVPEVWIIHRDTRVPQVYLLREKSYEQQQPAEDGWIRSGQTNIELAAVQNQRIALRITADESTRRELPEA